MIVENFYTADNDTQHRLHGFRVLAVDGFTIILPFTTELKECYGVTRNQHDTEVVKAKVSVLYDVLNGIALNPVLENLNKGERDLALRHGCR